MYFSIRTRAIFKRERIHLILLLITILFSFLLFLFIPFELDKYELNLVQEQYKPSTSEYYFFDYDKNGYSNSIELKNPTHIIQPAIKVFDSDSILIDQWNFSEDWLSGQIYHNDYDNDNYNEIYVFTKKEDSLFLYVVDPRIKPQFYKRRLFVINADNIHNHPQGVWDIFINNLLFIDCDNDGYRDIIIPIMSGLSLSPRKIIAYSIKKQQMISQTPNAGYYISTPKMLIDELNMDTLIYFSGSTNTNNINDDTQFKDNKAWLVVLDKNLDYKFTPIAIGNDNTSASFIDIKTDSTTNILAVERYKGKEKNSSEITLFDLSGNKIAGEKLSHSLFWNLQKLTKDGKEKYFIYNQDTLWEINSKLEATNEVLLPNRVSYIHGYHKLNEDTTEQIVILNEHGFTVTGVNFSDPVYMELPNFGDRYSLSIKNRGERKPQLVFDLSDRTYFFEYSDNPFYPFRFIYIFLLFAVSFLIVASVYKFLRYELFQYRFSRQLFQNAQRGVLVVNHKDKVIKINKAFNTLLVNKVPIKKGDDFYTVFKDRPDFIELLDRIKTQKRPFNKEFGINHENSSLKYYLNGYPLQPKNRLISGYLIELMDYSDPIHKERMRIWGNTVQRLVHNFKTPLASLQLTSQTIKLKIDETFNSDKDLFEEDFKLFESELKRLRDYSKNFLQLSNLDEPKFQEVPINVVINSAIANLAALLKPEIDVKFNLDKNYSTIMGDFDQIANLFQILLKNAIEAIPGKGVIQINTFLAQKLDFNTLSYLQIEVCDTGCGFSGNALNKAFEPYFTTKSDGSGIGLPIAKKIILEHSGTIEIDFSKDFSTIIRFTLPIGNIRNEYVQSISN